ncbi:hypothetical protein [Aquisalibacillus elongatus]|uniref:Uncharacterized protein n=1 Tax=Aquisalibacillus elongatus TaxID=485577 RepID=A0A3N5B1K7_9BACI|nr:hypothetical protein [Aquisalibacillus elongatus]RPF51039.1 hypothetical protein EDC24_2301 [Aquisalibacillus elongatus]
METSLILVSLTVFLTFLVLYAGEKVVSFFKRKKSTLQTIDQATNGVDMEVEVGHR